VFYDRKEVFALIGLPEPADPLPGEVPPPPPRARFVQKRGPKEKASAAR
jgi:hypothetical protein